MNSQQVIPRTSPEEEALRQERRESRSMRRRQQRRARLSVWSSLGMTILLLLAMGFFFLQIQQILGYPPINGISCGSMQYNTYHIHVHITIYINGKRTTIPQGIGIAPDGSCYYWLHTHTPDGIIHVEAPQQDTGLALDDFVTIWQSKFSSLGFPAQLTVASGWKYYVNGQPFTGTNNAPLHTEIRFHAHDAITLEYGSPNPPPDTFYAFPAGL
jgi:hypothetical protein